MSQHEDDKKEFKPDGKYHPRTSMLKRARLRLKMAKGKKKMNESDLFSNVKPGDVVHYKTPQGQHGKGKVVLRYDTHVVVNRGKGQPQVVNDRNYVKHERGGKVVGALLSRLKEASWQGANDPYNWDPVMRQQVFAAAAKKNRAQQKAKGQPVPHELESGRAYKPKYNPPPRRGTANEDSKDVGGEAERVAKTKKHKKKLVSEVSSGTLANYVTKAIADRKKLTGMQDQARRIHTPERAAYFVDKAQKKIAKRAAGIKTAVGKIASSLPAEPLKAHSDSEGAKHGGWSGMESVVNEVSAPGKEAWIKANKARFIAKYGKEKGTKILYAKAWKDSKATNEATRSEYDANIHMSQGAKPTQKGHYLMRDGRKLSGPHSPEEAVKAYKGLASQGTDTKGVKIVHVKEGVEVDVTDLMLSEAKVKEAAQKAISLAKKAKGNKHVDTKPSLDIADKGGGGPIEGSSESEGNVNAAL